MSPTVLLIGGMITKIAVFGGVGISLITGVQIFHTKDLKFKGKNERDDNDDFESIRKEFKSSRAL